MSKITYKRLTTLANRLDDALDKMKEQLSTQTEFEIQVVSIPGDGLAVLNVDTSSVARLDLCISIIKQKGTLSEEDHSKIGF